MSSDLRNCLSKVHIINFIRALGKLELLIPCWHKKWHKDSISDLVRGGMKTSNKIDLLTEWKWEKECRKWQDLPKKNRIESSKLVSLSKQSLIRSNMILTGSHSFPKDEVVENWGNQYNKHNHHSEEATFSPWSPLSRGWEKPLRYSTVH